MITPAERRVLALAATGLTDRQIAERLGVALSTVKNEKRTAYLRLHVRTRAAAFVALGWLTVPVE